MKRIKADAQQADTWIVTDGLADGDQIVVSGVQRVKPDAPAKATPWQPNADAAKSGAGCASRRGGRQALIFSRSGSSA